MKLLSLKLDHEVFEETEKVLANLNTSRNRYINEALEYYNRLQKRKMLASRLKIESELVSVESIKVLSEFEGFEDETI